MHFSCICHILSVHELTRVLHVLLLSVCILQVGAPLHWSHGYLHLFWDYSRFCRIILCLGQYLLF